jgi:hypothetical protein
MDALKHCLNDRHITCARKYNQHCNLRERDLVKQREHCGTACRLHVWTRRAVTLSLRSSRRCRSAIRRQDLRRWPEERRTPTRRGRGQTFQEPRVRCWRVPCRRAPLCRSQAQACDEDHGWRWTTRRAVDALARPSPRRAETRALQRWKRADRNACRAMEPPETLP